MAYKNRRCAMCRRDIPVEFLDHPQLLYKIEDNAATTEDGYQWFYEGRNGKLSFVHYIRNRNSPFLCILLNLSGDFLHAAPTILITRRTPQSFLGGWWKYDSRSSAELEEAHSSGLTLTELTLCGTLYTVSLVNMVQFNKQDPSRKRQIKREHVAVSRAKGVAGLLNNPQKFHNVI